MKTVSLMTEKRQGEVIGSPQWTKDGDISVVPIVTQDHWKQKDLGRSHIILLVATTPWTKQGRKYPRWRWWRQNKWQRIFQKKDIFKLAPIHVKMICVTGIKWREINRVGGMAPRVAPIIFSACSSYCNISAWTIYISIFLPDCS